MLLAKLAAFADDGFSCGTRAPGKPPPHPVDWNVAIAAQQNMRVPAETIASLWFAIKLHRIARSLPEGRLAATVQSTASMYFDDTCGNTPRSVLLQILLHHPPPPPPPFLETILFGAQVF